MALEPRSHSLFSAIQYISVIAKERVKQLEAIGFQLTMNVAQSNMDKWGAAKVRLQDHQTSHDGSCNVPRRSPQDAALGMWIINQRRNYKNGKLTEDREKQLEAIGFNWTMMNVAESNTENWGAVLK